VIDKKGINSMSWYARFRLWLDAKLAPKATSWIRYGVTIDPPKP
jgi:hypothetical protein